MDVYPGVTDSDPTKLQERHYYLLSELQTLVKDLPSSFQQRLTYNTLSDLALALIDGTVYEIVQGLLDIQHLTEKNLYNQRQKLHCEHQALKQDLVRKHKEALQSCKSHNLALLKSTQQTEVEVRSKIPISGRGADGVGVKRATMCRGYSPQSSCPGFKSRSGRHLPNVSPLATPLSCLPTVKK
ncbi:Protein dgcr6 [Ameca splendens]|uniref:Protein dgcr6 n=1 Tax=Ameca splendens TaxID=208324 RepID=A0ABV0XJA2_9TELE